MEYGNFLKYYYRKVVGLMKSTDDYKGSIADFEDVPACFRETGKYMHSANGNKSPIMGNLEMNIDAPAEIYEEWFDFMAMKYPDISIIFLGSEYIRNIFESVGKFDDESVLVVIDTIVNEAFNECKAVL